MKIDLTREEILYWANRYPDKERVKDDEVFEIIKDVASNGYMTKHELIAAVKWKSPRNIHAHNNSPASVREITEFAFAANSDCCIGILFLLQGVQWPTASAILHLVFPEKYPILDVWAMKAIDGDEKYNFEKWKKYVRLYQDTIKKHKLEMGTMDEKRTLDRALWTYGEHHYGKKKK